MMTPILTTKLHIPVPRPNHVPRSRLIERLNQGLERKLTLISAPAGFGKTSLASEWLVSVQHRTAWLELDEGDNDLQRFLSYLVAALQTIAPDIGQDAIGMLQSTEAAAGDVFLTVLLNDIAGFSDHFHFVLDDYQVIEAHSVHQSLTFLIEHLPPHMHLVIATREDPQIPLARLRARDQLTELRAADLRFTSTEAATFLTQVMGLALSAVDIIALEARTEGWIAGLQLAAVSLQGHQDAKSFIASFTGSHRFVMDYLLEEVLRQQPEHVQTFLLRTSILDRLCGPLCDSMALGPTPSGQETLEYLERANLFIVPLDDERRWYRYHHLFADLLRQRLQSTPSSSLGDERNLVAALHRRASLWYEEHDLEVEAFAHAVSAQDIDLAARLMEGKGLPLHFRGAVAPVLRWLDSLPKAELNARPALWLAYASATLFIGQNTAVEQKLQAAEAALQAVEPNERTQDLIGQIAVMRATLAVIQHDIDAVTAQSQRALESLLPDNLSARTAATWTLGYAYQMQGDRAAAIQTYSDVLALGQLLGDSIYTIAATLSLGQVQETNNQLSLAAEHYERVLQLVGDPPQPIACEAHLGLARVYYEWNDLGVAERHGQECDQLARQVDRIDTVTSYAVFLARLKLAQGDVSGASSIVEKAAVVVRQRHFVHQMPAVAAMQVLILLRQGHLTAAAQLAQTHHLPISQARVFLAQGDVAAALKVLELWRRKVETKRWEDERLKVTILQALALQAQEKADEAIHALGEAIALAAPGGYIRTFVDEGLPMARLLSVAATEGVKPDYLRTVLVAFNAQTQQGHHTSHGLLASAVAPGQPLSDPLSARELEVLRLIAQGLSNQEISERLYIAISTVKGHNRQIFEKLQVERRTEAVARALELGML